jgi:3,4-dihydroxy 2-butanone 4-phosphate synthase/GTP cyclohydrolase II
LPSTVTQDNAAYLATKIERMRHLLTLPLHVSFHSNGRSYTEFSPTIHHRLAMLEQMALAHYDAYHQPFVTLSYAQTLDGTIGAVGGGPLRISGPESLHVTHQLRAHHDAILVGIGTLLADNPQLTVRLVEGPQPQPIIVDSYLRMPLDARIWAHAKAPWIATLESQSPAAQTLRARGARILPVAATQEGQVELSALFTQLANLGIRSIMVEGGAAIIGSLVRRQLAHYAVITVAPRFRPGVHVTPPGSQATATIHEATYTQAGSDIILWGQLDWSTNPDNQLYTAVPVGHSLAASPQPTTASSSL